MSCCNNEKHNHNHEHNHNHDHKHEHEHDHEHEHNHDHNNPHSHDHVHHTGSSDDANLSHEEKTLRVLLVHWINHNKSHQDNFLEWVEKSKKMDKPQVADHIEKAVAFMEKANEMLIEAKKHM
ncbi:periplasmic zinc transporter/adhesin B precursor [Alkaliphilus metalliredigens QYMF]|uniref:Periplasmic zinc transporter/adhesin B n=1 Tax=Alkaliphilus metalliredigens (strain QYMF) TaxID=293826 RepID=A6TPS6_ALKMQ|nr:hypothetical protein [Alkaliphilus metalliredigens]ABR48194.1 periplasmic zinc transporter/adhesin B precursor [Alkaliphilus metalliredigens QYMF]